MCGYWKIHHLRNFNQNFVVPFKGVLDFDLQPHPGAGNLGSEVMVWMPTLQGNYVPNMNAFWSVVTEIYTTGETLTNFKPKLWRNRSTVRTKGKAKLLYLKKSERSKVW